MPSFVSNITDIDQFIAYNYTGGEQVFVVPFTGIYMLHCYGSMGSGSNAGYGGFVSGYKMLKKGERVYIHVGGRSGYNGGGLGGYDGTSYNYSGGATHMAYVSGQLQNIGYNEFVTNKKGLLVGGGGGGAGHSNYYPGGGGAYPQGYRAGSANGAAYLPYGGSQTEGGVSGVGGGPAPGSFGRGGGINDRKCQAPGGGGLFGGGGSYYNYSGGAGGSSYIAGCPEFTFKNKVYSPSYENAFRSDNGIAYIFSVIKTSSTGVRAYGSEIEKIMAFGENVESSRLFGSEPA